MMKAEPVADVTRNTHNYFAQGGNELVIGGKLTFLPAQPLRAATICLVSRPLLNPSAMWRIAKRPPSPR